jgi:tetratricopeptide (TPR) repeat protein
MAQLAGSDLTRQAIFLIEAGKARPSLPTLELIASRTGKPVNHFTRPRPDGQHMSSGLGDAAIEELEGLTLRHQLDEAVALGTKLLERPLTPSAEAHVRVYMGQALVNTSRPDEGLEHLRRAKALLEVAPDPWLSVECTDWEACALYHKQDSGALSVAENALRLCRATKPRLPGTEARILEHLATIHVRNHAYDKAVTHYEEALRTAGAVRDLARLGRTYHGLSIAYQERGQLTRAIEYTHKALALYALEHDTALLARGENELGLLFMRQGHMARAEDAFRTALDHLAQGGTERTKSHVLLSLGELQLKTNRFAEATATIKEAIALAVRMKEVLAESTGHQLLGRLHERTGKRGLADRAIASAIRTLRRNKLSDRLAEAHAAYAELLEARGDAGAASRHWKLAAKIALETGRRSERAV